MRKATWTSKLLVVMETVWWLISRWKVATNSF